MRTNQLSGIMVLGIIIVSAVIFHVIKTPSAVNPDVQAHRNALEIDKLVHERQLIGRYDSLKFYGVVAVLGALNASLVIVAAAYARGHVIRRSVHVARIGEYSEIPVHYKQVKSGAFAQELTTLATAEQLRQSNAGIDKAFALYDAIADKQLAMLRAMPKTSLSQFALPEASESGTVKEAVRVPSFADLLQSGEVSSGKPMILAYEGNHAHRGGFEDIYSSAIAGESGSGKTSTELFLIGSGLIAQKIMFYVCDPHYPHHKSLGFKLKSLEENDIIRLAVTDAEMVDVFTDIGAHIDRRLALQEPDIIPVVLVIDELTFLAKRSISKTLFHAMERISTEGRKCGVYMLASAQTWLTARTGGSSIVRDTLTSAYIHRIKPDQARAILQNKQETDIVRNEVKKQGQVLWVPVGDESRVCQMPYATEQDIQFVANMTEPIFCQPKGNIFPVTTSVDSSHIHVERGNQPTPETTDEPRFSNEDFRAKISAKYEGVESWGKLEKWIGIDKGTLRKISRNEVGISDANRQKLQRFFSKNSIVEFPAQS